MQFLLSESGKWNGQVLARSAPTYYGMMVACWKKKK